MTSPTTTDLSTLLMIDSVSARDRDDAFSVIPLPDGRGWAVEVHIAGVADVVELGSVADEQAFLRAETRYLRSRTIPMLGETAEQAATLTADSRRTSLWVTGTITTDGLLVDVTVGRGQVASGRCVAVDHAEVAGILSDPAHPLHPQLAAADAAVQVLLTAAVTAVPSRSMTSPEDGQRMRTGPSWRSPRNCGPSPTSSCRS